MERRVTATELARSVGEILAQVRYRSESFLIERNGEVIARIIPEPRRTPGTVGELVELWRSFGPPDPEFADLLEEVNSFAWPPDDSWRS
jgi:hypothetical protein